MDFIVKISKKMQPYVALADMISASFGNKCEVVLHDLSTPESSVVYVANGLVTNRELGQSFDHLVKDVLLSKKFSNDYNANYMFKTKDGRQIKSSTSLIRDEHEEVIGAFCINIEVDDMGRMKEFLDSFFSDDDPREADKNSAQPATIDNVMEIIDDLIVKTIGARNISAQTRRENVELVRFMSEKGIFLAKGSVDKVAEKLGVSPVTVYSYLDEVKKNKGS